jgi:hypothetical protein
MTLGPKLFGLARVYCNIIHFVNGYDWSPAFPPAPLKSCIKPVSTRIKAGCWPDGIERASFYIYIYIYYIRGQGEEDMHDLREF